MSQTHHTLHAFAVALRDAGYTSEAIARETSVRSRVRRPELVRPYRAGWNVGVRGRAVPLAAVIGGLGTFAAWVSVIVLHPEARILGTGWMLVDMGLRLAVPRRATYHRAAGGK